MIYLKEIFDLLAHGELANTKSQQKYSGSLAEEDYPRIVGHINLGLLELYKRFNLLQDELKLHILPSVNLYYLRENRVALIDNMNKSSYIESDADSPFNNNIIKVTNAFDSLGTSLPLNDRCSELVIQTIQYDQLKITPILAAQVIDIQYQASYPKIIIDSDFDPAEYELYIPEIIIEALLFYVAARVYKSFGSNSSTPDADKSVAYMQHFELACQKIDSFGLDTQVNDTRPNFEQGGFV